PLPRNRSPAPATRLPAGGNASADESNIEPIHQARERDRRSSWGRPLWNCWSGAATPLPSASETQAFAPRFRQCRRRGFVELRSRQISVPASVRVAEELPDLLHQPVAQGAHLGVVLIAQGIDQIVSAFRLHPYGGKGCHETSRRQVFGHQGAAP